MGYQDVAFLSSLASFPPHFINIVQGQGLVTTTCLKTIVGGK